jgi:hypothetical protein
VAMSAKKNAARTICRAPSCRFVSRFIRRAAT